MAERFITELNKRYVHYGEAVRQVRDMFARKQEALDKEDDKFFSKYWQVYAWTAIIGFLQNKRIENATLEHQRSFEYLRISNGSESIANALVLMAIGKIDLNGSENILNISTIIRMIGEYAEGGAQHILDLRQTPGYEALFNYSDDYFTEILDRSTDTLEKKS